MPSLWHYSQMALYVDRGRCSVSNEGMSLVNELMVSFANEVCQWFGHHGSG